MQFVPLGQIPITKTKAYSIEKEMLFFWTKHYAIFVVKYVLLPTEQKKKSIKKKQTLKQKIKKKIPFPSKKQPKINFRKI